MSGRRQPPVPGFLPATLGELDRSIGRANGHVDPDDDDDDCEICRALRELDGLTTTEELVLPDGTMLAITAMPPDWRPPVSMKKRTG